MNFKKKSNRFCRYINLTKKVVLLFPSHDPLVVEGANDTEGEVFSFLHTFTGKCKKKRLMTNINALAEESLDGLSAERSSLKDETSIQNSLHKCSEIDLFI